MIAEIQKKTCTYHIGVPGFRIREEEGKFFPQQARGVCWYPLCGPSGTSVEKATLTQALEVASGCAWEEDTRAKCVYALEELHRGGAACIKKYPYLSLAELYVCSLIDWTLAQLHMRAREAAHQRLTQEVTSCCTLIKEINDVVGEVIPQWAPLVTEEEVRRIGLSEAERDVLNDEYNPASRVWIFLPYHAGDPTYTYEEYRTLQRTAQKQVQAERTRCATRRESMVEEENELL